MMTRQQFVDANRPAFVGWLFISIALMVVSLFGIIGLIDPNLAGAPALVGLVAAVVGIVGASQGLCACCRRGSGQAPMLSTVYVIGTTAAGVSIVLLTLCVVYYNYFNKLENKAEEVYEYGHISVEERKEARDVYAVAALFKRVMVLQMLLGPIFGLMSMYVGFRAKLAMK